ncbi:hypothetical protein QYE76_060203 [Lolium multiflorum]|uniref:F-box/LRR-repeat protein 15/At3g58940/PEG3-like LRR domain-containing protein n=1 Tax=Lolium multiflorum TaxID=4521 RepID=A0AAD8S004_LOLMU|nr:hypothetical protein QYE76_060203 [Lolium multiflorum]
MAAAPDLISNQPDAVLGTIVSLLPTRDGCRTQGLSRRWRHIWRSAPLNLAAGRRDRRGQLPEYDFSKVLSSHLGPVRRIHIIGIGPLWYHTRHEVIGEAGGDARIDGWVGSRDVLASLEVLDIGYSYYSEVLPPSVFRLAPVLRVASFSRCRLPANLAVDFPSLEKLGLYNIFLTEEALCALLSGCPALRSLRTNVGSNCLRISAPALRSISFFHSTELVIEDAPFLERALMLNDVYTIPPRETTVRVVHDPTT